MALGTTGAASTLDAAERDKVLETCVDACRGRVPVVAGTGAIDTRAVVAMGRRARALGADGTLEQFKLEYETLFRALKKSNESEKRLMKKCRELSADIGAASAKCAAATKLSGEDQGMIQQLKKDIELSLIHI